MIFINFINDFQSFRVSSKPNSHLVNEILSDFFVGHKLYQEISLCLEKMEEYVEQKGPVVPDYSKVVFGNTSECLEHKTHMLTNNHTAHARNLS